MRRLFLLLLALCVLIPCTAHAQQGRGVRFELFDDVTGVLVSKDVGGQRWSIRFGLAGDTTGRITGIITDPNNPNVDPVFAQCLAIDATGNPDDIDSVTFIFACQVGPKCPSRAAGSCPAWEDVGTSAVPASFFLPPR